MHRYQVLIEYEGTNFRGWQIQKKGSTVQKLVQSKISKILNENIYNNDDCILIVRTVINRSKRLAKLIEEYEKTSNLELVIKSYKPPIFWKEKEIVSKQIKSWSLKEIKNKIYETSNLEKLIKKNSINSVNFISDFICNY